MWASPTTFPRILGVTTRSPGRQAICTKTERDGEVSGLGLRWAPFDQLDPPAGQTELPQTLLHEARETAVW